MRFSTSYLKLALALSLTAVSAMSASLTASLAPGKAELKSASQLAFGPDGVMFVGDSMGAAIFAIDTRDTKPVASSPKIDIQGINEKIAAMLGTMPDQIILNDVKVNPVSKQIYLAVSRGRGPDATPVILRVDGQGNITEFSTANVSFSKVSVADAPESNPLAPIVGMDTTPGPRPMMSLEKGAARSGNPRLETITNMAYVDGKVLVAGLSNEEFASNLRAVPFPFREAAKGSNVEIWHGSHGRFETQAPIRTFVPVTIDHKEYILAAYTCTPLVKIPVSDLKAGSRVKGTTIAELGNSNRPLDMVAYRKDGHDYLLLANSKRGMMKLSADNLGNYKAILPKTDACYASREPGPMNKACQEEEASGIPFEAIAGIKGVWQLEKFDDANALVLSNGSGTLDLKSIALP